MMEKVRALIELIKDGGTGMDFESYENEVNRLVEESEAEIKSAEEALKMQSKLCTEVSSLEVKIAQKDREIDSQRRNIQRLKKEVSDLVSAAEEAMEKQKAKKLVNGDCSVCGHVVTELTKYCPDCGNKFDFS